MRRLRTRPPPRVYVCRARSSLPPARDRTVAVTVSRCFTMSSARMDPGRRRFTNSTISRIPRYSSPLASWITASIAKASRASRTRPDASASRSRRTVSSAGVSGGFLDCVIRGPSPVSVIRLAFGTSRSLRRFRVPRDGDVDRDLRDVRRVAPRPPDAVRDHRKREELLPLLRRHVVREAVDHLLEGDPSVHGLVREVDVLAREGAERLVEDRDGCRTRALQLLEELRVQGPLPHEEARLRDPLRVVPHPLDELRDEAVVVEAAPRHRIRRSRRGDVGEVVLFRDEPVEAVDLPLPPPHVPPPGLVPPPWGDGPVFHRPA